ncbi:hypothetical protein [Altererythrobacter aquiaggeris]|uniref:hypothetical protein n=1 Tax=Aestuarierythrobacter aquiaggeris TaxID=1898396 RepID=UPI003016171A
MKTFITGAAAAASLVLSVSALGQSFTYNVVWEPVESIGGMTGTDGPQYGGGVVKGAYQTKFSDGSEQAGTVRCVGMDQPDGGIFTIHLACTTSDSGGTTSLVYGCNYLGEAGPDTALGCVGGIESKSGDQSGRRGGLTMEWYSPTQSRGTGQWYGE